jgi:O-antigen ligase
MNVMSMSTANLDFSAASYPARFAAPRIVASKQSYSPYLIFVWVAAALGVVAVFEPSPSDIAIVLLFVVGLFTGNLRWSRKLTLPFMLLGLFVLANLASLCYAIDPAIGALYLAITLFMLVSWMFLVGILTKYGERGVSAVMQAFTAGGVISASIAVLCYFNLAPFGEWVLFYDRIKGFFKDPNVFAPYLVIVAVYAVHRALPAGALWRRLSWLVSCLVASVGVLLCYSRAGWMNYVVTLLLFFLFTSISKRGVSSSFRNLVYFAIFAAIIAGAFAYAMTIPQISEVLLYRAEMQAYDADRFANFIAALRLGLNNPLGVGPGQSFLTLDYATHNLYLRTFSENGVIGFLTFSAFALAALIRSVVLSQKAANLVQRSLFAVVAAALCGALLNSFTIDTLHWRHLWLLLALGWMPLWTTPSRRAEVRPQGPRRISAGSQDEHLGWSAIPAGVSVTASEPLLTRALPPWSQAFEAQPLANRKARTLRKAEGSL